MKEFEEWDGYVESEGRKWPCFGRFDTKEEREAAKEGWKGALENLKTHSDVYIDQVTGKRIQAVPTSIIDEELNENT